MAFSLLNTASCTVGYWALDNRAGMPITAGAPLLPSQGTVLVVSMDASLGQQDLLYLFSQFGDVKGIEQDPTRPNCHFVEFYDVRHAGVWNRSGRCSQGSHGRKGS